MNWFDVGSRLHPVMLLAVRALGLLLLSQGTTSSDLCVLLAILGLGLEQLYLYLQLLALMHRARRQGAASRSSVRKVGVGPFFSMPTAARLDTVCAGAG
jgi:hypothetical protein